MMGSPGFHPCGMLASSCFTSSPCCAASTATSPAAGGGAAAAGAAGAAAGAAAPAAAASRCACLACSRSSHSPAQRGGGRRIQGDSARTVQQCHATDTMLLPRMEPSSPPCRPAPWLPTPALTALTGKGVQLRGSHLRLLRRRRLEEIQRLARLVAQRSSRRVAEAVGVGQQGAHCRLVAWSGRAVARGWCQPVHDRLQRHNGCLQGRAG